MKRLLALALVAAAAPSVVSAQDRAPWTPYFDCSAYVQRLMFLTARSTADLLDSTGRAGDPKSDELKRRLYERFAKMADPARKEYEKQARRSIDQHYETWAAEERRAGRAPAARNQVTAQAQADAEARAGLLSKPDEFDAPMTQLSCNTIITLKER